MKTMLQRIVSSLYYILVVSISIPFIAITGLTWFLTYKFGKRVNAIASCATTWVWYYLAYYIGWPWGWRVKIEGKENLPEGPYILMANHQDLLDIPIILGLKRNLRWVSKKEVLKLPLVGLVLIFRGDVKIERGSATSAKRMLEDCSKNLDMGMNIVIHPEGTRTKDGEVGRFKPGGFLLAKEYGCQIVPAVIVGNWGCLKGGIVAPNRKFMLKVLPPVSAEEVKSTDTKELMNKVREQIVNEYEVVRHIN